MDAWWYAANGEKIGPKSTQDMTVLRVSGRISVDTLIWKEGFDGWKPLSAVSELASIQVPPLPPREDIPPPLPSPASQLTSPPEAPPNKVESLDAALESLRLATRWPRFFARMLDMWLLVFILSFLIAMPLVLFDPAFGRWLNKPGSQYLFAIPIVPLYLAAEAACYAMFGNTPGKALLAIKIGDLRGRKLTFEEFLKRNFKLWGSGLAFGIPLVCMFTYYNQARRVYAGQPASYDEELGTRAFGKKLGAGRIIVFSIIFVILSALMRAGE